MERTDLLKTVKDASRQKEEKMRNYCRQIVRRTRSASAIFPMSVSAAWSWILKFNNQPMAVETEYARLAGQTSRNLASALVCLIAVLSFPRILVAAEWSVAPSITMELGHDSNPTLTTGSHDNVSSVSIIPRIKLSKATEVSAVNVDMLLSATKYSGNEVPDTDRQILSLHSFFQTTERAKWGLDGELRRDILFESIQTTSDTGDLQDTDVGLVSQKVRRDRRTARPSWSYALSERSSLGLRYGITDVSYSNASGTGLVEYKNHKLSATYTRRITDSSDLNIVANHSAYRPAETSADSDTTQLLAGISHAYSETARGRFLVGVGKTSEDSSLVTEDTSSYVLEMGLVQRSELTTFNGVISRDVQPSGVGRSVISDQIRLNLARKISPMLSFVLRAKALRNKVLEGSDPGVNRRYYEFMPGLSWQWKQEWAFDMGYQYRRKEFDANPNAANSNALFVGVTYGWPRQVTSR